MLRQALAKAQDSIFGLVIKDHIESIGKPILLKGDELLLNDLVAQVLSDIAPKPSTTFSYSTYVPNLKSNSAPPI